MNICNLHNIFQIRLKREQEEKEQKKIEKSEAHLYTIIKVYSNILGQFVRHPCLSFQVLCIGGTRQGHERANRKGYLLRLG